MANKIKPIIKTILFVITIISFTTAISCQNKKNNTVLKNNSKMSKYEWLPSASAPKLSPIEITKGYFKTQNGQIISIPTGHNIYQGWGVSGPMHVVGESLKPIPTTLDITWLSFREKKFYTGSFKLQPELIKELFSKGFTDRLGRKDNYKEINIGMAPGGVVTIWLLGSGKTTEIGTYKANITNVEMKDFAPNSQLSVNEYIASMLDEGLDEQTKSKIDSIPIPFGVWDMYRTRYSWKPQFKFNDNGVLNEVLIDYFNGEKLFTIGTNPELKKLSNSALPRYMKIEWQNKISEFGAKVYFNEKEIFDTFKTLSANKENNNHSIFIETDKYNGTLTVSIKSDTETIILKESTIKIYETSN